MAENGSETPEGKAQTAQPTQVKMQVLAQYVRDLSFENIMMQKGVAVQGQPDVQVQVHLDVKKRSVEHQYEVITKFQITSKKKDSDDALFMIELEYAGVFHVENVPKEQLHPYLLIECPRMLFPFVRRIVSDVTRDGGFPPLNMDNIDFVSIYRQSIAQRTAAAEAEKKGQPVS